MAGGQGGSRYRGKPARWVMSDKQEKFIRAYAGNATKAAREAGYKEPASAGKRNMDNKHIRQRIQDRRDTDPKFNQLIADREERQAFWTKVLRGDIKITITTKNGDAIAIDPKINDRLKASELLGKSEGDFVDKHELTIKKKMVKLD